MSRLDNPYAATLTDIEPAVDDAVQTEEASTRREYLRRETMIRSLGSVYYLSALFLAVTLFGAVRRTGVPIRMLLEFVPSVFWLYAFLVFVLVVTLLAAWGLRRLAPWARVPVVFFATLGLFTFPAGTGFGLVALYLVLSPAAWVVFSPEYREVIERTPHIRYGKFKAALILCGLVAWMALLGVAAWAMK